VNADDFFDAVAELGRAEVKRRRVARIAAREARNARRRELYARRPKRPRMKTAVEPEPDYEPPTECYCNATSRPPCGWCENGGES